MQEKNTYVEVAIIGAGTAGLNALREVKSAGKSYVLIDRGPLGTTCARVGCMPSKAVLHAAAVWQGRTFSGTARAPLADMGPDVLWREARKMRDTLAVGAANKAVAAAGDRLLMGQARFIAPNLIDVEGRRVMADAIVVATGSTPAVPTFLHPVQDRLLTTDSLFELETLPGSVGILGLGAVGLEIGLALSRLGVRVIAADVKTVPAGIVDPEVGARATEYFTTSSGLTMWLGKKVNVGRTPTGVSMSNGIEIVEVEWVLSALGRKPVLHGLQLDAALVAQDERGYPVIDPYTMRAGHLPVYFAGDVTPDRPLQHEAADEGVIAGWNAARHGTTERFRRRVPLSIVFSDPDIAAVGMPFDQLDPEQTIIGAASGRGNGRSRVMGAEENFLRIYADRASGTLLGASVFATRGEHLAHLLAWAIQRGETAQSLLEMPFYHPTVEEMVQTALADIVRQQGDSRAAPPGLRVFQAKT